MCFFLGARDNVTFVLSSLRHSSLFPRALLRRSRVVLSSLRHFVTRHFVCVQGQGSSCKGQDDLRLLVTRHLSLCHFVSSARHGSSRKAKMGHPRYFLYSPLWILLIQAGLFLYHSIVGVIHSSNLCCGLQPSSFVILEASMA